MKKKLIGLVVAGVTVFALSGCSGGDDEYNDGFTTLFVVDVNYNSVNGIDYDCDSHSGTTFGDGEFSFYPGDDCKFYMDNLTADLFIVDISNNGKDGIPYDCSPSNIAGDTGDTGRLGEFDYATYDECIFYL